MLLLLEVMNLSFQHLDGICGVCLGGGCVWGGGVFGGRGCLGGGCLGGGGSTGSFSNVYKIKKEHVLIKTHCHTTNYVQNLPAYNLTGVGVAGHP